MKNSPQPRYNVESRYQALLDAGEELFCAEYDLAKPKLIAEKAGVSVGLFYRHFQNKREMLTTIMVKHLNLLHTEIERQSDVRNFPDEVIAKNAIALTADLEPEAAFYRLIYLTLKYFHQHQQIIKLFFLEVGYGDFVAMAQLNQARQNYRNFIAQIITAGMRQGIFLDEETLDLEIAINSIIGTINWSIYDILIVHNQNLKPKIDTDRLVSHLLRSLIRK